MGKALALGEAIIVLKELWDSTSDLFIKLMPTNFYKMLDEVAFLNCDFLGVGSGGNILDNTKKIADAVIGLSNLVVWGILIIYSLKILFGYFISKRFDTPWKFFVRMIIFGVLSNAAFFICYTGIFFSENCTEYIRSYVGENQTSFNILEEYVIDDNIQELDGVGSSYSFEALITILIYVFTLFVGICLCMRYILIKLLILLSPIFFVLGGFKSSEKIFFCWCKVFFSLIFAQVLYCIVIAIINFVNLDDKLFSQFFIFSILLFVCKNIMSFFKLCR